MNILNADVFGGFAQLTLFLETAASGVVKGRSGAGGRIRTADFPIQNRALYPNLSYALSPEYYHGR